jgi:arginine-tRNA-protein transferase
MTALSKLKVYATHPHPCSYIAEQQATTLFIDPETNVDQALYSDLAEIGFRRSGPHIYRPHCESCSSCIAARIPVDSFKLKRSQRKLWNRNSDIEVREADDISPAQYYKLYERYIRLRHADGDMYPPNIEQYLSFLSNTISTTKNYVFSLKQQMIAVAVTDVLTTGLSAMYTFFDPEMERRSLGSYAILWQIQQAKQMGLPFVYLGYWIKESEKMNYKIDYRPLQLLVKNQWVTLS